MTGTSPTTEAARCNYSDLYVTQCAHCRPGLAETGPESTQGRKVGPNATDVIPGAQKADSGVRVAWTPADQEISEVPDPATLPNTWQPNSRNDECRCGRPTRDHAYLCDDCGDTLARALGDVPWTIEQLDISITRQRAALTAGSSTSSTSGLPWNEWAANAKRTLHTTLATWVRWCNEERVRNSDPGNQWPDDNPQAMSRWLLWRVDGLAYHETGPDAAEQITDALAECRRVILFKRAARVYLGQCGGQIDDTPCPGDVYAREGDPIGQCEACGREYPVGTRRADLERTLDDRLFTAAELARLATFLGLDVPRERVRQQVHTWAKRGRIVAVPGSEDAPMYRYGEVRGLLYATYARKEG